MKRLTLLVCLVAIPIAIFANAHEPYQGDFDLDGDVDFADFLTFASNYGKTGGSTTPSNRVDTVRVTRVDTVRVVVRDTIYIDSGNGGNPGSLSIPSGLAGLGVSPELVPTGWKISVTYLDFFGNPIWATSDFPKWRNPDKITVIIRNRFNNEELYRSDNIIYQRSYDIFDKQSGLEMVIPKSEISDIYRYASSYSVFHFTTRVVVEFDGVPYSGEG